MWSGFHECSWSVMPYAMSSVFCSCSNVPAVYTNHSTLQYTSHIHDTTRPQHFLSQRRIWCFTKPGDVQSIWKRHRRSSVQGAEGGEVWEGIFFCISYIKMVSFLCIPGDIYWHRSFEKKHPNQKGGCPDTLDPPLCVVVWEKSKNGKTKIEILLRFF